MNYTSGWYKVVDTTSNISQGEILFNCPILIPNYPKNELDDFDFQNMKPGGNQLSTLSFTANVIILSQACDLAIRDGQTAPTLTSVLVAALRDVRKTKVGKNTLSPIAKLDRPPLFLLEGSDKEVKMGYQIVQFDALYTLPWKLLDSFSKKHGPRLRLNSPYIEQLSQHLGNYFSRVAIPENRELVMKDYYKVQQDYDELRKAETSMKMWGDLTEEELIDTLLKMTE